MNNHDGHNFNFGVCTTCAWEKANFDATHKALQWTDDPKIQKYVQRKFAREEFLMLTTPDGRGGRSGRY